MKYWIVSDTHFSHDMLVNAGLRPYNADELMIKHWKNQVSPEDLVSHLGDVAWPRAWETSVIKSLPGRKILVMGNHDKKSAQWYMENGFEVACNHFMLRYGGFDMVFTHKPWVNHPYDVNIHGHYHNNFNPVIYKEHPELYCISMEVLNYAPMSMNRLVRELQANFAAHNKKNASQVEAEAREELKRNARHFSERFEDLHFE